MKVGGKGDDRGVKLQKDETERKEREKGMDN